MTYSDKNTVIQETKNWINKFVIALNICPFAGASFGQDKIKYEIVETQDEEQLFRTFLLQLNDLILYKEISNGFLILPDLESFDDYLEFYNGCEQLLKESETDLVFQLASFHPLYLYDGLNYKDPANFRNRSPFPMIHILRVDEVEDAIGQYGDTLKIPEINAKKLREMGEEEIDQILKTVKANHES